MHTGPAASVSARSVQALAYTAGSHIVFRDGAFAPSTGAGRRLLAHELAHVVQQQPVIRRQAEPGAAPSLVPGGGATPVPGEGLDLIFVVDDPKFIPDIVKYVEAVFPVYYYVETLDQIFDRLETLEGQRVKRIRLITHGLIPKRSPKEGWVKFHGNAGSRWVTPKEVARYAQLERTRRIIERVMAPGAVVEFWGCSLGRSPMAGEAWANLFQSTFKATTETFRTGWSRFPIRAKKGMYADPVPGRPGWVYASHSDQIGPEQREAFRTFLLAGYQELVFNGDILPVDERGTEAERTERRLSYMTTLFNRSLGDVKYIEVTKRTDPEAKHPIRPGQREAWAALWKTFEFVRVGDLPERRDEVPAEPPPLPTDIEVREPDAAALSKPFFESAKPPASLAPLVAPPVAAGPEKTAPGCATTESSPAGPFMGRVSFGLGSASVIAGDAELSRFALSVGGHSAPVRIRVDGYASTDGPEAQNFQLSCRRAHAVRDALIKQHGFSAAQLRTYAHGETSEFARTDPASNRLVVLTAAPVAPSRAPEVVAEQASPPTKDHQPTKSHRGPHLLMTGLPAALMVERLLPTSHAITVSSSLGWVRLVPGTVWDNDKMLVWPTEMTVYYTQGPNLYEAPTWMFLQSFYFDALSKGAKRAEHWVVIAEVELALIEGAFVPVWAIIIASLGSALLKYIAHRKQIDPALRQVPRIIGLLADLYQHEPKLFNLLLRSFAKELLEVIVSLPKGITAKDVAFFIGRLFHRKWLPSPGSWTKWPSETPMWVPEMTLAALSRVVFKTASLVFLTHAPSMGATVIEQSVERHIEKWRAALKEEGVTMSQEEARVLFEELHAHPDAKHRLLVLQAALQDFLPALKALRETLSR